MDTQPCEGPNPFKTDPYSSLPMFKCWDSHQHDSLGDTEGGSVLELTYHCFFHVTYNYTRIKICQGYRVGKRETKEKGNFLTTPIFYNGICLA